MTDVTIEKSVNAIARTAALCVFALLGAVAVDIFAIEAGPERTPLRPNGTAAAIDWQTSPLDLDLRGMNGARYLFHCPPGKPLPTRVVGSGPYTDDSSICSAAVHAGTIGAKDDGDVTIEIRPGEAHYAASERNDIRTAACDHAWSGSFAVLRKDTAAAP
jgi:LCCL domain-containing protein